MFQIFVAKLTDQNFVKNLIHKFTLFLIFINTKILDMTPYPFKKFFKTAIICSFNSPFHTKIQIMFMS